MKRTGLVATMIAGLALFAMTLGVSSAAAVNPKALILAESVTPGSSTDFSARSLEEEQANNAGFDTTVVTGAQWDAMTAADFATYQVLIIGDPTCATDPSYYAAAQTNASTWQPVVMSSGGNKVVIGTDPTFHRGFPGAVTLERDGIAFAGAKAGATGAYIDLSCAYTSGANDESVPILDGLSTHGPGQFAVDSAPCEGNIAIVAQSGPTSGLHDADLSNWSCSVHESFVMFPSDWTPLAVATDAPSDTYCANDVDTGALACGEPYIMVSGAGVVITSSITLTPASATNPVGGDHTVTATITDSSGNPVPGKTVAFSVDSGPNAGKTGTGVTNANGQATFTYHDDGGAGTDGISAQFTNDVGATEKDTATKTWEAAAATLSLSPATASNPVGSTHTVTATLKDSSNNPISGATILFSVSGANTASGSQTTDSAGNANFTYTGSSAGDDAIAACYDANNDNTCEAVASATKTWTQVNKPPDCSKVAADPHKLWPPNHKLVQVTLSGVTDPDGDPVTITVTGVTQDEPLNGTGDGNTSPDAQLGPQPNQVKLRAERAGNRDGRVYRIAFQASDGKGGTCIGAVEVGVPHDLGKGATPVDSGQTVNSLGP